MKHQKSSDNIEQLKMQVAFTDHFRNSLASKKKYGELKKTYSGNYPEIVNKNSGRFWDNHNKFAINLSLADPMANERIKFVASMLNDGERILDLGFGAGYLENELVEQKKFIDLVGVDISRISVKRLKMRYPHWSFTVGDASRNLSFQNKFNTIVALEIFEHIPASQILHVLKKLHKILKVEGRLIVSVPLNEGLEEMLRRGINPNAHVRIYTPDILRAELIMSKFIVNRKGYFWAFHKYHDLKTFIARSSFGAILPNNMVVEAIKR